MTSLRTTSRIVALKSLRALAALALLSLPACGPAEAPKPAPVAAAAPTPAPAPVGDDALAERYIAAKERFAALDPDDHAGSQKILTELGPGLREVAEAARDAPLRANASLLLGRLYEAQGDPRSAISFYRQAAALLPEEVAARRVLAIALAADRQYPAALVEQRRVVQDDPDDLEAWLLLGELAVKADKQDEATAAYASYELRRKGLIDGLTLKSADGTFPIPADQRAACARALIPARDNGTAVALIYALQIETDPLVRQAIVEAMGTQRLGGYRGALEAKLAAETSQDVKEALAWALAEIQRDPLDTRPGPAPAAPTAAGTPTAPGTGELPAGTGPAGQADKSAGTGPAGQVDKSAGTGPAGQADKSAGTGPAGQADKSAGTGPAGQVEKAGKAAGAGTPAGGEAAGKAAAPPSP